jgi:hypothetical protein
MLTIREAQMSVFRGQAADRFDRRMLAALVRSFPRDRARLGDGALLALARRGRERAALQGWRTEQAVYLFLTLALMFGIGFDSDPQLPWMQQALVAEPDADPVSHLFEVHARALDQLDAVEGEHNEHLIKALLRQRALDLARFETTDDGEREAVIAAVLAEMHPRKADTLGQAGLLATARAAGPQARTRGLHGARAQGLVALLRFMLGHRFDDDPAHPWVGEALSMPGTEADRTRSLHQAALGLLAHGLG